MNQDDMFHPEIVVGYYEGNILDAFVLRNIAHIYIQFKYVYIVTVYLLMQVRCDIDMLQYGIKWYPIMIPYNVIWHDRSSRMQEGLGINSMLPEVKELLH